MCDKKQINRVFFTFMNRYIRAFGVIFFAAYLVASFCCCAGDKDVTEDDDYALNGWMSMLSDTTKVCKVSIPGTHDALTGEGFTDTSYVNDYTTQVASFDEQLNGGLRYFDVRLVMKKESGKTILQVSHRTATIKLTYKDVLTKAKKFLTDNPSEFIIMKIQYDGGVMTSADKKQWIASVQKTLTDTCNAKFFVQFKPDLRVGEARGKILLLSRTDYGDPVCGALTNWIDEGTESYIHMDSVAERTLVLAPCREAAIAYMGGDNKLAARLYVQDFYNSIGKRIDEKMHAVEAMYRSSQALADADNVWILNHTSGFSTPKMNAIGYAENASKSNAKLLSLLADETSRKSIGIVAMDFACRDTINQKIGTLGVVKRAVMSRTLTRAIIDRNRK